MARILLLPLLSLQLIAAAALPRDTGKQSGSIIAATLPKNNGTQHGPIIATYLRGKANSTASEASTEEGHYYNAEECKDCVYKGKQCGCQPVVEFLACFTKHCHASNTAKFSDKCTAFGNKCFAELDLDCRSSKTVCQGKYNQLPTGGLGFTMNVDEDDAFCGPFGKCIGKVHARADVHVPKEDDPKSVSADTTLECGLQKVANATIDNRQHWDICQKGIVGGKAACHFKMSTLPVDKGKEVYCVITRGRDGERLTQPVWRLLANKYDKKAATKTEEKDAAEELTPEEDTAEEPAPPSAESPASKSGGAASAPPPGKKGDWPWMKDKKADKDPPPTIAPI